MAIFRNDPGFANTNSNIESFNSTLKRDFTKRFKCSFARAIEKLFSTIIYYSNDDNPANIFNLIPEFDSALKVEALKINSKCFKLIRKDIVAYKGVKNAYRIRLDDKRCWKSSSCNCATFIKWAICRHIVAYSNANELDWYGAAYRQPVKFVTKTKKGAIPKKKIGRFPLAKKALIRE